jgi:hypothetical protein
MSLSSSGKSPLRVLPSCPRGRGVGHRHRTLGWDAVDAAHRARDGIAGRINSVSDVRNAATNGADAYGKIVWFRRLNGRRQVFRRRDKPNRAAAPVSAKATEAEKPDTPGRARHKPSSHCAGNVGSPPLPCMLVCDFSTPLHTGPRVQRASGIPCSLLFSRDNETKKLGHLAPRERGGVAAV